MESIDTQNFNLYNSQNKLVSPEDLSDIFEKVGLKYIKIHDLKTYQQAFVHKSYISNKISYYLEKNNKKLTYIEKPEGAIELFPESNERMEFLGDSIVGCVVVSYLYRRFFEADEGFMTKLKSRLVKTDTLGMFSKKLGLDKFLVISQDVENSGEGRTNIRILEDLFEAFIGAMFLDLSQPSVKKHKRHNNFTYGPGYSYCETFIINIIEKYIDFEEIILNDGNYKDQLLKVYQQSFSKQPKYIVLEKPDSKNNNFYTIGVADLDGNIIGKGQDKTKKRAEQQAALEALHNLK